MTGEVRTERYGPQADQVADLHLPAGDPPDRGWPTVVVLHGGFWRERYLRDLTTPIAVDLAARGLAAWNVEYRRVPEDGRDTWPATLTDVAVAVDRLAMLDAPVDPQRVAVVGHSAGGQLALWVAGRTLLPHGAPGGAPVVRPLAALGLAPVASLRLAEESGLGDGAAAGLLGGDSTTVPARWDVADPVGLVGHGVRVLLVHGTQDESVPVSQSEAYADAAGRAGDEVEVVTGPADHMAVVDPDDPLWQHAATWCHRKLTG